MEFRRRLNAGPLAPPRSPPAAVPAAAEPEQDAFPPPTHPRSEELFDAVQNGDADVVSELLAAGVPPGCVNDDGCTALMLAAEGEAACVELLLGGTPLNHRNAAGDTALILAIKYEDLAIVKALLGAGADPSLADDEGKTALDHARDASDCALAAAITGEELVEEEPPAREEKEGGRRMSVSNNNLEDFTASRRRRRRCHRRLPQAQPSAPVWAPWAVHPRGSAARRDAARPRQASAAGRCRPSGAAYSSRARGRASRAAAPP